MINKLLIFIFFIPLFSCEEQLVKKPIHEEKLLNIFRMEYNLTEQYQEHYILYLRYQLKHFKKKNQLTNDTIKLINDIYDGLSEDEKSDYQLKWQSKFQPIIDKLHHNTRQMIINESKVLSQDKMAQIQELTTKIELLEKDLPRVTLAPQFFIMPTVKENF
ncbi:hypothetical protein BVY03_01540 [bacterium K02(2017)]|nr:hypothetical protein BVY03_01540 [bacterium K02(2017)]